MFNSTMQDNACKLYFTSLQLKPNSGLRESSKGIKKKPDQPDNRRVVDLVMHSNKQTGPSWRIHPKTFRTFQFIRNFAIWQIVSVTRASLNLDRFCSACILATIQYFKLSKSAMMDQFVTFPDKGLLARKEKK